MTISSFGRYQIKRELARGGMATVYHAWDPRFGRDVALKVLPREFLHNAHFSTRFKREAQTVAQLEHAAIVPVYDFGEQDSQPYVVMRYMTGGSLAERLLDGPLSIARTANILHILARGLDKAHQRNIIHRDLKPGNIMFDEDGAPHITDFGIAKLLEQGTGITQGALIGTPAYMSPEQAHGENPIDQRSDIYSLGVLLFEMLTGYTPYSATTSLQVAMKQILAPVPNILDFNPHLPPQSQTVIDRALAKDPADRYATAPDLADAVLDLAAAVSTPSSATLVLPRQSYVQVASPPVAGSIPQRSQAEAIRLANKQARIEALAIAQSELQRLADEKAAAKQLAVEEAEARRLAEEQAAAKRLANIKARARRLEAVQAKVEQLQPPQSAPDTCRRRRVRRLIITAVTLIGLAVLGLMAGSYLGWLPAL